jgi:hypothetical protein
VGGTKMTGLITPASTALVPLNGPWKKGRIICGAMKLVSAGLIQGMNPFIASVVSTAAGDFTLVTTGSSGAIVGMDSDAALRALLEISEAGREEVSGSLSAAGSLLAGVAGTGWKRNGAGPTIRR